MKEFDRTFIFYMKIRVFFAKLKKKKKGIGSFLDDVVKQSELHASSIHVGPNSV